MTCVLSPRGGRRPTVRAASAPARHSVRPRRSASQPARGPVEWLEPRTLLTAFFVTTTDDAGPGSLRAAIEAANATPAADEIRFNVPGPGVHTIAPLSPLPTIAFPLTLNGPSQPGYAGQPLIELNGAGAGALADGLVLGATASGTVINGLAINRFGRHGIVMGSTGSSTLRANVIGADPSGGVALGNGGAGVLVTGPASIGAGRSSLQSSGNLISGNTGAGVWVATPTNASVEIFGNLIGTDATGARALGNGREGILVDAGQAVIGGIPSGSTTRGNVISGNGSSGVRLSGGDAASAQVVANFIGTDATGARAVPNGTSPLTPFRDGITSQAARSLRVGGPVGARNVISGNAGAGLRASGGSGEVTVQGNYVGTDATGNADVGNGGDGVWLVTVGSIWRVQGNVISGNGGDGVHAEAGAELPPTLNVFGNNIGTNANATGALGNDGNGVRLHGPFRALVGGPTATDRVITNGVAAPLSPNATGRNVISANGGHGVLAEGTRAGNTIVTVQGNYIGTDVTGNTRLGNAGDGVRATLLSSQWRMSGNLVSANAGDGIHISDSQGGGGRTPGVGGNYIGTNADGAAPLGNGGDGIDLESSFSCVIGGSVGGGGVFIAAVNPAALGRNLISGNAGNGILVSGQPGGGGTSVGHFIGNNYIGTDATGSAALGNGGSGIYLLSGPHQVGEVASPNVISGNAGDGITIVGSPVISPQSRTGSRVMANKIGTNAAGSDAVTNLGNGGRGVAIYDVSGTVIGDPTPSVAGNGNTIAFNRGSGVAVEGSRGAGSTQGPAVDNRISHNAIFSNGGLGIDLVDGYEGVTPNDPRDADLGANRLQNFPVLSHAAATATSTTVRFTLNAQPSATFRVEFFASAAPDPSGFGEGRTFLTSVDVTTDAEGNGAGSATFSAAAAGVGAYLTATAIANTGSTSEFSAAVRVTPPVPATVAGRHVFYNGSTFDGSNPAAGVADDAAIATDKQALLPGAGPATFANVTSYSRGINGVMIDVDGLPLNAAPIAEDFSFRVGRTAGNGELTWSEGPALRTLGLRRGAGVGGSDRVTLIWESFDPASVLPNAVTDGWLEVTMKAVPRTGLARPDVFAFGNLVGETGDRPDAARVSALDLAGVKRNLNSASTVTGRYDFNRDGRVNATDLTIVRLNLFHSLRLIDAPPAPEPVVVPAPAETLDRPEGVWARLAV